MFEYGHKHQSGFTTLCPYCKKEALDIKAWNEELAELESVSQYYLKEDD